MAKIILHLDDFQFQKLETILSNNGQTDLNNETFSGTEICVGISPYGHFLDVSGYKSESIGEISVELLKE